MGIESLSGTQYSDSRKSRAGLAAICALFPGMGAVYNRQNIKAIVHFMAIVGLLQLSGVLVAGFFFFIAGLGFYFYSIIDAFRTAQLIARGEDAEANEARFKRAIAQRAPVLGLTLIVVGILTVIQLTQPFGLALSLINVLPPLLIVFGGYLLIRYLKRSSQNSSDPFYPDRPYRLTGGHFEEGSSGIPRRISRPGDRR